MTYAQAKRMIQLWADGVRIAHIANELGVTISAVRYYAKRYPNAFPPREEKVGRPRHSGKKVSAEDESRMYELYSAGIKKAEIARRFDVSYTTVQNHLEAYERDHPEECQ